MLNGKVSDTGDIACKAVMELNTFSYKIYYVKNCGLGEVPFDPQQFGIKNAITNPDDAGKKVTFESPHGKIGSGSLDIIGIVSSSGGKKAVVCIDGNTGNITEARGDTCP